MSLRIGTVYSRLIFPHLIEPGLVETLTGYGNHEETLEQIRRQVNPVRPGAGADNAFRLHRLAEEFVDRLRFPDLRIREIRVTGHADKVFRNGGRDTNDELRVSQRRAEDAWREFLRVLFTIPSGLFTPQQFSDAIRDGLLTVIVAGVGARFPVNPKAATGSAENRRVVIELSVTQSTPI